MVYILGPLLFLLLFLLRRAPFTLYRYPQVNMETSARIFLEGVTRYFVTQSLSDPFQEDGLAQAPIFYSDLRIFRTRKKVQ
jgi:hypothetical protein